MSSLELCLRERGIMSPRKKKQGMTRGLMFTRMDSKLNMQWVTRTLVPAVGNSQEEKVIFVDNVAFQQEKEFHDPCRNEINAIVYLLPENHRHRVW